MPDSKMQTDDGSASLVARAGVYELLSRIWLYEVDANLLAELADGSLATAWRELNGPVVDRGQAEALATEYCRVFVGPRDHVPPFQSVWESGQHGGEAVASMREYIELLSDPVSNLLDLPDHLGTQLLLMGVFLRSLAGDSSANDLREIAVTFFAEHLSWPDRMLDAAVARSEEPFYRFLAKATREFLRDESAVLKAHS